MSGVEETSKSVPSASETNNIEESTEQNITVSDVNTSTVEVADVKTLVSEDYVRLRVITSDLNNEVHFRVKMNTPLIRLKRSYCRKLGQEINELRFVFDGHRITDEDTPIKLGMINDDVVEIYQERSGGGISFV